MALRNCMRKMKCATTMGVERQAMNSMSIRSKGFSSGSIKTPRCHLRHRNLWHGGDRYRHRHRHRHAFRTLCVSKDRSESEANCNPTDATDRELLIEDLTRRLQVAERALQVGLVGWSGQVGSRYRYQFQQ